VRIVAWAGRCPNSAKIETPPTSAPLIDARSVLGARSGTGFFVAWYCYLCQPAFAQKRVSQFANAIGKYGHPITGMCLAWATSDTTRDWSDSIRN
jgi:hypothetical protein